MIATQIARVVHEANRALQVEQLEEHPTRIPVGPSWDDLDEETKRSAVEGVQNVLNNPDLTAEQSHESWMAFKEHHGWTYGETKDDESKTHPLLVPFADLPPEAKVKDELFIAITRVLADA